MKKKSYIGVLVLALLIVASFAVVIAANEIAKGNSFSGIDENGSFIDANGKIVDPFPVVEAVVTRSREDRLVLLEKEKADYIKAHPPVAVETKDAERQAQESLYWAEFWAEANKDVAKTIALLEKGVKIVNKYAGTNYEEKITNAQVVDRDMLAVMVDVIEQNNLTPDELHTLQCCLADKYCNVLPSDPIYPRMMKILGASE